AIPIISLFAVPPAGDDASKFLQVSGLHPLLVSLIALLLIILFTLYACKKGVYSKAIEYLRTLWQAKPSRFNKWQAIGLPAAILLLVAIAFAANQLLLPGKIFETSFTMNIHDNLKVMEMPFDVKTSRSYNMSLSLDAEGMLTDVRIFDDKGSMVYQNISEWFTLSSQVDLETGKHLLVLTFIRDPEAMVQYFEENKYTFSREQIDTFKALLAKKPNDKFIPVTFSAAIQ
ncbi:MAG: hypothetical protein GX754_01140, partial [Clostridiaceae bacterium]|nr:hypothetical protein [Clostridiaceae bacterium]